MSKTTIVQVICLIFINSIWYGQCGGDSTLQGLTSPTTLNCLKDVTLWIDKKNTSLKEILGDDLTTENVDTETVRDVAFKALCCSYTKHLMYFVQLIKRVSKTCTKSARDKLVYLRRCRKTFINMFAVARHYSKILHSSMDKNFSNAFMSMSILLNDKNCKTVNRSVPYINNALQLFDNEYCSVPNLENHDFPRKTDSKQLLSKPKKNRYLMKRKLKILDLPILKSICYPYELSPKEIAQVQKLFHPANYMLTDFIHTRVVVHDSGSTRIKHLAHHLNDVKTTVKDVHGHVSRSFQGEDVFKYQMLVVEHTGALMLFLISAMIDYASPQIRFGHDNDALHKSYYEALQALESLRPASLIGAVLRDLKHHELFGFDKQYVLDSINFYFQSSTLKPDEIANFIHPDGSREISQRYTAVEIARILDGIARSVRSMAPNLFAPAETGLEQSDDMFGKVMLITNAHMRNNLIAISVPRTVMCYCTYSFILARYFTLADIIVSECGILTSQTSDEDETVGNCFSHLKSYIEAIRPRMKKLFQVVFTSVSYDRLFAPVSRKLLEALYSITLYLDNDRLYHVSDLGDVGKVEAKIEELKRAVGTIVLTLEQFLNDRCPQSFRDMREFRFMTPYSNEFGMKKFHTLGKKMKLISQHFKVRKIEDDGYFINTREDTSETFQNSMSTQNEIASRLDGVVELSNIGNKFKSDYFDRLSSDTKRCADHFHVPEFYLFESVVKNQSEVHCELSEILTGLRVDWYGQMLDLGEVYDFVRSQVDFRYVYEYHTKFKRMILFVAYEKIINIIQSIGDSQTKAVDEHVRSDIGFLLHNFFLLKYPSVFWIYQRISRFFNSFSREKLYGPVDFSAMTSFLKKVQSDLGVEFNRNDETDENRTECSFTQSLMADNETCTLPSYQPQPQPNHSKREEDLIRKDVPSDSLGDEDSSVNPNDEEDENQRDNSVSVQSTDIKVLDGINQLRQFYFIVVTFDVNYNLSYYVDLLQLQFCILGVNTVE